MYESDEEQMNYDIISRPWVLNNILPQNKTIYFLIDGKTPNYKVNLLILYFINITYTKTLYYNNIDLQFKFYEKYKLVYVDNNTNTIKIVEIPI
jgi:hypothetical protein